MSKLFPQKSNKLLRLILVVGLSAVLLLGLTMCTQSTEAPVAEEAPAEEADAPAEEPEAEEPMEEAEEPMEGAENSDKAEELSAVRQNRV